MTSNRILNSFRLFNEKENFEEVIISLEKGVVFRGTNLWILIFAIFIASLGLNVNSTAVIIGAMLISPLMGPIMGIGLSLGINDLRLLRKSIQNYLFALLVGLITSTVYFLLSPINDAHSEILARTQPNIYDVLIAFFGGLAGILAISSKQKGNVIPGVAIATALMPPLCTAGYGLATLQWEYFAGASYLFLINSVFIALATLITVRYLKFPIKHLLNEKAELKSKRVVWAISLLTFLPSLYFGYAFIQDNRFNDLANSFIDKETKLKDDYLLNKNIDVANRKITLTYGGAKITDEDISLLQDRFAGYNFKNNSTLEIQQGFSYLEDKGNMEHSVNILSEKDAMIVNLQHQVDTLGKYNIMGGVIFKELKINYPAIGSVSLVNIVSYNDSTKVSLPSCIISAKEVIPEEDLKKINAWLKIRLAVDTVNLIIK